jgi:hypothetical protein
LHCGGAPRFGNSDIDGLPALAGACRVSLLSAARNAASMVDANLLRYEDVP